MIKRYFIIGGTGGIGQAIVEQLLQLKPENDQSGDNLPIIFASYHQRLPALNAKNLHWIKMDICDEHSIKSAIDQISKLTEHLDWVINCAGMLHSQSQGPEKSIRQIEADFFIQNMLVNALPSLLIAKHIKPLLKASQKHQNDVSTSSNISTSESPSIYATISARVGSISDNQVGGWYSYRMSKAALNMGMKTLAIEWSRTLKNVCVVVMQPGTVDTDLSKPFQANVAEDKLFTSDYSAAKLIEVLSSMSVDQSGSFVDWSGAPIPW